jgi:hypothetical protein
MTSKLVSQSELRHTPSKSWILIVVPFIFLAPWLLLQHRYGVAGGDFLRPTAAAFSEYLGRMPSIAILVGRELITPGHWGLVWPSFFCAVLIAICSSRYDPDLTLAATVILALTAYSCIFMFSAWPDVTEHVRWSIARLLVPLAPIALLFTAQQVWTDVAVDLR